MVATLGGAEQMPLDILKQADGQWEDYVGRDRRDNLTHPKARAAALQVN